MTKDEGLVRINIRISRELKEWMDEHSKKTGMSLSIIGMLALEDYMKEKVSFQKLEQLQHLSAELEKMKRKINIFEDMPVE